MISLKIGKRRFALLAGKLTNDSYSATIKKLALVRGKGFAQIAPAGLVAGKRHVAAALEHAISAMDDGTAFTRSLELEFIVRLLGEKQLDKVLAVGEMKAGSGGERGGTVRGLGPGADVILVSDGKGGKTGALAKALGIAEAGKFDFSKNRAALMEFYRIGEKELETVSDLGYEALEELVIERISMVALER